MSDTRLHGGNGPHSTSGSGWPLPRRPARRVLLTGGLAAACLVAGALWYAAVHGPRDALSGGPGIPTTSPKKPLQLRVLYAGNPASDRSRDFATFLGRHFEAVRVADLRAFRESDADGFDVVLIDWAEEGGPGSGPPPEVPTNFRLTDEYSRPTVLIGGAGGQVAARSRLKFKWLCLCLGDAAYRVTTGHEIFGQPFPVSLEEEQLPAPELYRHWPTGPDPGAALRVWRVQERHASDGDGFGLVCDPYGFEDSPDAEVIASGINSKNPQAVAIARQANFLLWGFSARPSAMTPSGQTCFLNAVHYVRQFDGRRPLVRREADAREWALVRAAGLLNTGYQGTLRGLFPDELCERLGHDLDTYMGYYRDNLEYLRPVEGGFLADEEVKGLGLSNRKIELLDRCVAMLETGDRPELALRILRRYTTAGLVGAQEWRAWLEANRGLLFCSDVGGYKFRVLGQSDARAYRK